MPVDIAAVVGADNMNPRAKDAVISILAKYSTNAPTRLFLFGTWARSVGATVTADDLARVANAGGL